MLLPKITARNDTTIPTKQFGGLNLNYVVNDGEWADMKNMSNDLFPIFAPRMGRGYIRHIKVPQGICGGKHLSYVDNNEFWYDETKKTNVKLEKSGKERNIVTMGAYVCIFPDGVVYNAKTDEVTYIKNQTKASGVHIYLCKLDGTRYDASNTVISTNEPTDKTKFWIDTSTNTTVIKMYSQSSSMWVSVPTTYVQFVATGIGKGFKPYDSVKFSGVDTNSPSNKWIYNDYDFNQTNIVFACDDNSLTIAGFINLQHDNTQEITFERELPEMEFICENDNRLWGCSSETNEIYACKQGDPTNWYAYQGLVTDSYAVTTGTQNRFTGCVSYGGYVYFFKEDGYHKVFGNRPSNYEVVWKPGVGVQQGSEKSICVVGDYLVIKAREGFYLFDGAFTNINENLGAEPFYEATASHYRNKYYVSMRDTDYNYRIYVYDIVKRTWCVEDNLRLKYLANTNSGMYFVRYDTGELDVVNSEAIYVKIFPMGLDYPTVGYNDPTTSAPGYVDAEPIVDEDFIYPNSDKFFPGNVAVGTLEEKFEWMFETGDIDFTSEAYKYIKRIVLRLSLDVNAKIKVHIMYDSSDDWMEVSEYYATKKRSYELPVQVQRCDHFRLRFSGFGDMKLFSLAKVVEGGSTI